jgi:hypothetical protein
MGMYSEWRITGFQSKQAMQWKRRWSKKKGRPKLTWMDNIKRAMSERNVQEGQWMKREEWRLGIGKRRYTF